jgi:hypothetical protein
VVRMIVESILGWFFPATGSRRAEIAEELPQTRCALCGAAGDFGPVDWRDPRPGVCAACFEETAHKRRRLHVTARALPLDICDGDSTPLVRPYVAALGTEVRA